MRYSCSAKGHLRVHRLLAVTSYDTCIVCSGLSLARIGMFVTHMVDACLRVPHHLARHAVNHMPAVAPCLHLRLYIDMIAYTSVSLRAYIHGRRHTAGLLIDWVLRVATYYMRIHEHICNSAAQGRHYMPVYIHTRALHQRAHLQVDHVPAAST